MENVTCYLEYRAQEDNTKMTVLYMIFIIVSLYVVFSVLKRWQKDKKCPGPPGKPFLGVLCDLDLGKVLLMFDKWS